MDPRDPSTDLRNTRARLIKLAIAAAIGAILTFFTIQAMLSSGPGPNKDPVAGSSVAVLAVAVFLVTTTVAHRIVSFRSSRSSRSRAR
jgi:hypothetical protein